MSKGGLGATKLTEVSKTPKIDNETPAQKQAAAKLALRKQLEKTLLQVRNLSFKIILVVPKYQNCSDLLWEKIVLVIEKNLGREFAKILRSLEQFDRTVKGQNNFGSWRFLRYDKSEQLEFKLEKII